MKKTFCALISLLALQAAPAWAGLNLGSTPLYLGASVQPIVMLNLPRDHQLYVKAYNDFSDLDADGIIETEYKHSINYYGYFDSFKCYDYDAVAANNRFFPFGITADKYCTGTNANKWSGNFLNWAAMARIDVVRKVLYGGLRVIDTQALTVLERTVIPTDVHAWSKFYSGGAANDISKLTPFNVSATPNTYTSNTGKAVKTVTSIARTARTISGIVASANTATVTTSVAHGFAIGSDVFIAGASQPLFNGAFVIASVPSTTTFTYTTLGTAPGNSATGTASGSLVTVTSTAHGFSNGTVVVITGADQLGYNGAYTISAVTTNTFQYTAATPAGADSTNAGISATVQGTTLSGITNSGALRNILVGDQVRAVQTTIPANSITGTVTAATSTSVTFNVDGSTGGNASTIANWTITNLSSNGISICNVTPAATGNTETTTAAPLMRVVVGNYGLWHVIDGRECLWSAEGGGANGNRGFFSELNANQNSPAQTATGSGGVALGTGSAVGEFTVRVKVCDPALLGQEKCLNYPGNPASSGGVWKPVGLLQDYSSANNRKIKFGLFTGSYSKNTSGGVLRKNADFLDSASPVGTTAPASGDEVDTRDGTFTGVDGMIKTLNKLRIFGYDYVAGNYGADSDGCNTPGLLAPPDGTCSSWGNPISEIYSETLRYLAGKGVNTAFTPVAPAAGAFGTGSLTRDAVLGLNVQGWKDPLAAANNNFCAPLNVVVFNASVNSYDNDQVDISSLSGAPNVKVQTKNVGAAEGITATSTFLIGDKGNSVAATAGPGGICTPKLFDQTNGLGDVMGICPEAPALKGTYLIAGAAYWAHTNRIRTDLTPPATDTTSLKVKTYGISLNTAVPKMVIPVPGTGALATPPGSVAARFVTLLPTGKTLNAGSYRGGGTITDFKVVRQDLAGGTGKFFVSWEDSLQGNDYDLDQWGVISYQFVNANSQIRVTSQVVYASAGFSLGFGFIITGTRNIAAGNTNTDGEHHLSAHKGDTVFNYISADGTVECVDCQEADGARSRTFDLALTPSATVLNEPLFYASKYGGFNDLNANGLPDQTTEWDNLLANGSAGTDGVPDNFFQVTNPAALETSMDRAFIFILQVSSASSVATNSTSLNTGSTVYQARFNSNEWSGQLLAFAIDVNGVIDPTPIWDAGQRMTAFGSRIITTYNPGVAAGTSGIPAGIPFRFASLTAAQQTFLNTDGGSGSVDAPGTVCAADQNPVGCTVRGPIRVNWLRGDQSNEGATATRFRVRPTTVLGDIVNSTPRFVGPPSQSFSDASYIAFRSTFANRVPMLYVGGNDGMMHGFEASTGATGGIERLAYVPSKMYPTLTKLTAKSYSHKYYVDGSPTVSDACFGACAAASDWHTVVVGGYNSGEQGYYALDVTNPALWTDETQAAKAVMWEFTDANDADLGFSYSKPLIAKMANGRWAAIFGNGYNSSTPNTGEILCTSGGTGATPFAPAGCTVGYTGHAYLYVVFLDGGIDGVWTPGVDFIKISTNTGTNTAAPGTATPAAPNGLATPVFVDTNGDGLVDFVYAGDLVGNMWKFDVQNSSPAAWTVASGGIPLFTAQDFPTNRRQPITSAPTLFPNPAGGFMVLFGTGKYLETGDDTGPYTQTNSFYGIWDRLDGTTVTRSQLMIQKVLNVTAGNPTGALTATNGSNTNGVRITSAFQPNYTESPRTNAAGTFGDPDVAPPGPNVVDTIAITPASQNGWALDLPNSADGGPPSSVTPGTGEKVVFDPLISTGKVVFTTLLPSNIPCQSGGTSFLMDIDPVTGSRLQFTPFDLNGDKTFNSSDFVNYGGVLIPVSGLQSTIGIVPQPTVIQVPGGQQEIKVLSGSSGGLIAVLENPGNPGGTRVGRRISWRELLSD